MATDQNQSTIVRDMTLLSIYKSTQEQGSPAMTAERSEAKMKMLQRQLGDLTRLSYLRGEANSQADAASQNEDIS